MEESLVAKPQASNLDVAASHSTLMVVNNMIPKVKKCHEPNGEWLEDFPKRDLKLYGEAFYISIM